MSIEVATNRKVQPWTYLMLVIDDSPYGAMRFPIQIGSLHIDMAIDLATEAEMKKLSCKWERARMAHLLRMGKHVQ